MMVVVLVVVFMVVVMVVIVFMVVVVVVVVFMVVVVLVIPYNLGLSEAWVAKIFGHRKSGSVDATLIQSLCAEACIVRSLGIYNSE